MKLRKQIKEAGKIAEIYRITKGADFRLKDFDPADTNGLKDQEKALKTLQNGVQLLSHLQEKLYAQDRWAVLMIFQAMDAAGKARAVKALLAGLHPHGRLGATSHQPCARDR